jgi:replicative DNA helicase
MDSYSLRRQGQNMHDEADRRNRIREGVRLVTSMPLIVTFRPGINPKTLQGELRKLQARQGLDLVIVDYLQLMSGGSSRYGNRTEEVSSISRALKRMAGELSIPVVALSQFSRESAKENREPQLSDLRESGSIEQDATLVLFVHFTRGWDMRAGVETGDAKLIVAKQRNGACTWIPLTFHAPTGRFYEPDVDRTKGARD